MAQRGIVKYSGIIVAGGKSSRMGTNKALVTFRGKSMVQYAVDLLSRYCDEIILVGNGLQFPNTTAVSDVYPDSGPLGGIHAGLLHAEHEQCIVLSCDNPMLRIQTIETLMEQHNSEATIAECMGQVHPLIGIYNKSILPQLELKLKSQQLRLISFLEEIKSKTITFPVEHQAEFTNMNTPKELSAWNEK